MYYFYPLFFSDFNYAEQSRCSGTEEMKRDSYLLIQIHEQPIWLKEVSGTVRVLFECAGEPQHVPSLMPHTLAHNYIIIDWFFRWIANRETLTREEDCTEIWLSSCETKRKLAVWAGRSHYWTRYRPRLLDKQCQKLRHKKCMSADQ